MRCAVCLFPDQSADFKSAIESSVFGAEATDPPKLAGLLERVEEDVLGDGVVRDVEVHGTFPLWDEWHSAHDALSRASHAVGVEVQVFELAVHGFDGEYQGFEYQDTGEEVFGVGGFPFAGDDH